MATKATKAPAATDESAEAARTIAAPKRTAAKTTAASKSTPAKAGAKSTAAKSPAKGKAAATASKTPRTSTAKGAKAKAAPNGDDAALDDEELDPEALEVDEGDAAEGGAAEVDEQATESAAAAEYGAEFRRDIESFVSREALAACVVPDRVELPPVSSCHYTGFVDPSGGSQDSFTLAVAHRESDGRAVLVVERQQVGVERHAARERLGAVDRVEDPGARAGALPLRLLLADDRVVREPAADLVAEEALGGAIGLGHGREIGLVLHVQVGRAEPLECDRIGAIRQLDQEFERLGRPHCVSSAPSRCAPRRAVSWRSTARTSSPTCTRCSNR